MTFQTNPHTKENQDLVFEFEGPYKAQSRGPNSHLFIVRSNAIIEVDEWQGNYAGGNIWRVGQKENELERALNNAKQWNESLYLQMMQLVNR